MIRIWGQLQSTCSYAWCHWFSSANCFHAVTLGVYSMLLSVEWWCPYWIERGVWKSIWDHNKILLLNNYSLKSMINYCCFACMCQKMILISIFRYFAASCCTAWLVQCLKRRLFCCSWKFASWLTLAQLQKFWLMCMVLMNKIKKF